MNIIRKLLAVVVILIMLAGCSGLSTREQRVLSGGAIGAGTGAALGAITGGSIGVGAAVGGAAGLVGGLILDEAARRQALR